MSLGRFLYEVATTASQPFLGLMINYRAGSGKEVPARKKERFAHPTAERLPHPLVWLHGASIGETRLLLAVARELLHHREDLNFLLTSQTVTSASLIEKEVRGDNRLAGRAHHQFLPVDTPSNARRFLDTWTPDTAVFAEGDVWPNLLKATRKRDIPTALINARMTERSLRGWQVWPGFARELFGGFDIILAADQRTAKGLSQLTGRTITSPGNLKTALPAPRIDHDELERLKTDFVGKRACLVAVSTHPGEEALALDAVRAITPVPACILVPRHPDRGDEIAAFLAERGLKTSRRSAEDNISTEDDVLLADTLGEVGLFTRLADTVFLGGGHARGIGGHNPMEILKLGKPVMTGPDLFNFDDLVERLRGEDSFRIVETAADIAHAFPLPAPSDELLQRLDHDAEKPMTETVSALLPLLPARKP